MVIKGRLIVHAPVEAVAVSPEVRSRNRRHALHNVHRTYVLVTRFVTWYYSRLDDKDSHIVLAVVEALLPPLTLAVNWKRRHKERARHVSA